MVNIVLNKDVYGNYILYLNNKKYVININNRDWKTPHLINQAVLLLRKNKYPVASNIAKLYICLANVGVEVSIYWREKALLFIKTHYPKIEYDKLYPCIDRHLKRVAKNGSQKYRLQ